MSSTIANPVTPQAASLPATKAVAAAGAIAGSAERASRSGIWVGIFAISMSFAAFTSALFVREGTTDWTHFALPSVLYLNTLILLASSGALEMARRKLTVAPRIESAKAGSSVAWLLLTLGLGMAFCVGQYMAWQELRHQGIYLATNPNSSFFYVLTCVHALHVIGGILTLGYLAIRLLTPNSTVRRSLFLNAATYWHFMSVLWVYLLLLCRFKL